MTRLTTALLARIRALPRDAWAKMDPRLRAALLVALGFGGGVVVTDPPWGGDKGTPVEEHSTYMDAQGDLAFVDCTFGGPVPERATKMHSQDGVQGSFASAPDAAGNVPLKLYTNTEWGATGPTSGKGHAVMNMFGPLQQNIAFVDCSWRALEHDGTGQMRWGIRGYGLMGVTFTRCAFSGGMAAGSQVALRQYAAHGDVIPQGVHRYERCTFTGIGDPASERWGAFTISEHAPEGYSFAIADVDVEILDCKLIGGHLSWTDGNGTLVKSPRGIMVNGHGRVSIERLHLDYEAPYSEWAIQLWNDREVRIVDSYVREGRVEIIAHDSVEVADCTGGAYLVVKSPGGAELHKGALSAGYMFPAVGR
jgi:hypothetical protein